MNTRHEADVYLLKNRDTYYNIDLFCKEKNVVLGKETVKEEMGNGGATLTNSLL